MRSLFAIGMGLIGLVMLGCASDGPHRDPAADFQLASLVEKQNPTFDLESEAGKSSYYDFMRSNIGKKMLALAPQAKASSTNVSELQAGNGVSVKLSPNNFNIHVNFPDSQQGGRSYGWTSGQVGDWSDAMYLDHLQSAIGGLSSADFSTFYQLLVQMLGACNTVDRSANIEKLPNAAQRVATNFLAIYTAEEYRAMVNPKLNWDDALFQVTMLEAFHSGQKDLTKFFEGTFQDKSTEQGTGTFSCSGQGTTAAKAKSADMSDYWQFSKTSKDSGINETRCDFEKMGTMITTYESTVAHNASLSKIQAVVGSNSNVIEAISQYFTTGKSKLAAIPDLAQNVADFLMFVHQDAQKITDWQNAKGSGDAPAATGTPTKKKKTAN
jgi:hypothetical protein